MKKIHYLFAILIAFFFVFNGCHSSKEVTKPTNTSTTNATPTEITLPFSEKEYLSDKDNLRAKNMGKSPDLSTAKKIALMNAKSELASNIQSKIKKVTDNYTNQRTVGDRQDFENKFEDLAREVASQTLTDVKVIGEKVFKENDGSYTYWTVIEVGKQSILDGINKGVSKNAKLQLDYDKKKFEDTFNDEMNKLENESK